MKVVQRRSIHPYQRHCPHCDQIVIYKTYKAHKRLYYNRTTGTWIKKHDGSEANYQHTSCNNGLHEDKVQQFEEDSPPCSDSDSEYNPSFGINETPPHSNPALSSSDNDDTYHSEIDGE